MATLDGVLALDFRDGYVPRRGDAFTLLSATESISGTFASVVISGLPAGFAYSHMTAGGQGWDEAGRRQASLERVHLPLVVR